MNIASYYASVGFNVNTKDIQKVDRAISSVEKKLVDFRKRLNKTLGFEIGKFNVNERNLQRSLGNALDMASSKVAFEISRFVVNDRALLAALLRAARRLPPPPPPGPNPPPHPPHPPGPGPRPNGGGNPPPDSGRGSRSLIGAGLYGPLGYGALALAGGGYGLGALNRRNQEVVSAQLQSQAVVQQAGGTAEQGQASFQYLRSEANRIGFNYLDASADYNKLISGLTGSGFGVRESQKVFSGFAELARVNKLNRTTQNRLFRALSQVAGKDQLMAEELTGQIAEALPGGVSLFAQAYKRQTGKDLGLGDTSANSPEDIKKLLAAMKNREVRGEILIAAGQIASERANKGGALDLASQASQAQQALYQNRVNDLAVLASSSGVEEGFARIFRTLNAGLGESNGLVQGLAESFNEATKWADDLALFPQSFVRALEGKDSLVGDWLGYDTTRQLVEDWKQIKELWSQISSIKAEDIFGDFLPSLQSTSKELADILSVIREIKNLRDGILPTTKIEAQDIPKIKPFDFLPEYTSPFELAKAGVNNFLVNLNQAQEKSRAISDPNSIYYNDPAGYDQMEMDRQQYAVDKPREDLSRYRPQSKEEIEDFNNQQKLAAMEDASIVNNSTTTNEITIQLNIDPITLAQMDIQAQAQELTQVFAANLGEILVQFPQKE